LADEIENVAEVADQFLERAHATAWCSFATVDRMGRPRSRILHPIWEVDGLPTGWIITRRHSFKEVHLANNPYVSLAYIADITKPVYVDCRATWDDDLIHKQQVWEMFKNAPPPLGYDPALIFATVEDPGVGLLKLIPWRVQLDDIPPGTRRIWHGSAS
jgi:hypothetical protein